MNPIKFLLQFEQQILAAMLLAFHSLIWFIEGSLIKYSFIFVLYGLFLLWQPLWSKESSISKPTTLLPIVLMLSFSFFFLNESLIFFALLVSGLIGSRLFTYTSTRTFDLLTIAILIIEIAIGVIPYTFEQIRLYPQFANLIQAIVGINESVRMCME
jgi:hypothetical protein